LAATKDKNASRHSAVSRGSLSLAVAAASMLGEFISFMSSTVKNILPN
jgi:hypothetical protein